MICVIGCGPGQAEWIPPACNKVVNSCDVIIGSERLVKLFSIEGKEYYSLTGDLKKACFIIKKALSEGKTIGVLVSGDPGFYSLLPMLKQEFSDENIKVFPGISSLQLAFAKAKIPWQNANFVSTHGREIKPFRLASGEPTLILTGGDNTPQKIALMLLKQGFNPKIFVGKSLAYEDELWFLTDAKELAIDNRMLENSTLILYPQRESNTFKIPVGIPDNEFVRDNVPMTKEEIRVQLLVKARILPTDIVLDVGAGTGSLSIEAAMLASSGRVYAVEGETKAQELIKANCLKFGISNIDLICGTAPEVLDQIPVVDACIIGGSRGKLSDIINKLPLKEGGRLVISAVTLETVNNSIKILEENNYCYIDIVSLQVVRWPQIGKAHMAQALNPVFIISAIKGGKGCLL